MMKTALADELTVDLSLHTITYEDKDLDIFKTFPIVGPKPENLRHYNNGKYFNIDAIAYKPSWEDANGNIVPFNKSPLGIGIIRFKDLHEGQGRSCGIHGNARENDLGKNLSGCCIRMRDEDFLQIFYEITYDTKVIIHY